MRPPTSSRTDALLASTPCSSSGTSTLLAHDLSVQADFTQQLPETDDATENPPDDEEPPYSPATEIRYFISQAIPPLFANLLE